MPSITIAARKSPLSLAQIDEVLLEIRKYNPDITFEKILLDTTGDIDLKTSLRTLDKTDFFTKEVDNLLLNKQCRIAVHSAKDLPDPIKDGLQIVAITKGVDPSDSLVLQEGMTLDTLRQGAIIATSSIQREETVKKLRSDLTFQDIRGTIGMRLEKLQLGLVDGVVIAEAALIRLKLTHLNRIRLEGKTTPLQGKLAILAHIEDAEMHTLFAPLDTR